MHILEQSARGGVIATKWRPFFRTARSILSTIDECNDSLDGYPIDGIRGPRR